MTERSIREDCGRHSGSGNLCRSGWCSSSFQRESDSESVFQRTKCLQQQWIPGKSATLSAILQNNGYNNNGPGGPPPPPPGYSNNNGYNQHTERWLTTKRLRPGLSASSAPNPAPPESTRCFAGTRRSAVRTAEAIHTSGASPGRTYPATIDQDVLDANGNVVVPRGSQCSAGGSGHGQ